MSTLSTAPEYPLYPAAVFIPAFSLLVFLLDLVPFVKHCRNRSIGPASLVGWLLIYNLINFLNALIWPRDDYMNWWDGSGFCDVQVRLMIGAMIGLPAALTCIMRDLAAILDTNKMVVTTRAEKQKTKLIVDSLLCFGLPIWFMVIYYIVQDGRYFLFAIQGCDFPLDPSWPSVILIMMWPPILTVVNSFYAGLVIYRLHRYRRDFSRFLSASSTTISHFIRLFSISIAIIVLILPIEIYALYELGSTGFHAYHWSWTHSDWNEIVKWPTYGHIVLWDRYMWIIYGFLVFVFFGTGTEAKALYRSWATKVGLSGLISESKTNASHDWISTLGSKTTRIWKKLGSSTGSRSSRTSSDFTRRRSNSQTLASFKWVDVPLSSILELPIVESSVGKDDSSRSKSRKRGSVSYAQANLEGGKWNPLPESSDALTRSIWFSQPSPALQTDAGDMGIAIRKEMSQSEETLPQTSAKMTANGEDMV